MRLRKTRIFLHGGLDSFLLICPSGCWIEPIRGFFSLSSRGIANGSRGCAPDDRLRDEPGIHNPGSRLRNPEPAPGGASTMCNGTSGNDGLCRDRQGTIINQPALASDHLLNDHLPGARSCTCPIRVLLVIIVVGIVAGWLAGRVMEGGGFGLIGDLLVGLIGAFIGDWLLPRTRYPPRGGNGRADPECLYRRRRPSADPAIGRRRPGPQTTLGLSPAFVDRQRTSAAPGRPWPDCRCDFISVLANPDTGP